MIFPEHKILFIHNPKCAGSAIKEQLKKKYKERPLFTEWHYNYNQLLSKHPMAAKNYFKIVFTRNPYDRFVSAYYYNMERVANKGDYHWKAYPRSYPVLEQYLDKDINDFIQSEHFSHILYPTFPIHFNKQIYFINEPKAFDLIGKYETMESDLKKIGITSLNKVNKSSHGDYNKILSKDSMKKLEELYKTDFKMFEEIK